MGYLSSILVVVSPVGCGPWKSARMIWSGILESSWHLREEGTKDIKSLIRLWVTESLFRHHSTSILLQRTVLNENPSPRYISMAWFRVTTSLSRVPYVHSDRQATNPNFNFAINILQFRRGSFSSQYNLVRLLPDSARLVSQQQPSSGLHTYGE